GLGARLDVRSGDALDAPVEEAVDRVWGDVGHPGGHTHPVAVGDAAQLVQRLRREHPVLAVQVHGVEAGDGGQLDHFRGRERQGAYQVLLALPVPLEDRVLDPRLVPSCRPAAGAPHVRGGPTPFAPTSVCNTWTMPTRHTSETGPGRERLASR